MIAVLSPVQLSTAAVLSTVNSKGGISLSVIALEIADSQPLMASRT